MERLPKKFWKEYKDSVYPPKEIPFHDRNVPLKIFEEFSRQIFNLVEFPLPWKENGTSAKAV